MDTANWKWFRYDEIFVIKKGKRLTLADQFSGNIPYISSSSLNNGVDNYIGNGYTDENCISFACYGSIGEVFYHSGRVWISDNANVFYIKGNALNKYIAFFLMPLLYKEQYRFSYGMTGKKERLKSFKIKLPVKNDKKPDWQWIENYVKDILIPKLPLKAKSVWKNQFEKESVIDEKIELNTEKWQWFNIIDFFNMFAGKYYPKDSFNGGHTPLISATKTDNGVVEFTDLKPAFNGNCITISKVEMANFYQPMPFCATADVTVLVPKFEMSKFCALFLKVILDTEKYRWSYGNQIRLNDCQKIKLKLPATVNGSPDWQFMGDYIKSLPYSRSI
jgi:hypothetical protein